VTTFGPGLEGFYLNALIPPPFSAAGSSANPRAKNFPISATLFAHDFHPLSVN
jgi:hypothetical protein